MASTWAKCSLYLKKADWFRVVNERGALKELQIMLYVKIDHLIIHFTVQGTCARTVYVRPHWRTLRDGKKVFVRAHWRRH